MKILALATTVYNMINCCFWNLNKRPLADLIGQLIVQQEFLTPKEILTKQAEHLTGRTGGLVAGEVLRDVVSSESEETRIVLRFEVVSARLDKRIKLFEAAHREGFEYPVSLTPPTDELPDYLKANYYQHSFGEIVSVLSKAQVWALQQKGNWIENDWVASTPVAFAKKIQSILALPSVKSMVMSLLAKSNQVEIGQ